MPTTIAAPKKAPAAEADFLPLEGTDYVEFYVGNARQAAHFYKTAFGFQSLAYSGPETGTKDRVSYAIRQNKRELVLANGVARAIFDSGFRSAVGQTLKTEDALVKMRGLFGIADVKFNVIRSFQRQKILLGCRSFFRSCNGCWHRIGSP